MNRLSSIYGANLFIYALFTKFTEQAAGHQKCMRKPTVVGH